MELLRCDSGREKNYLNLEHADLIESKCSELHGSKEKKAFVVAFSPIIHSYESY